MKTTLHNDIGEFITQLSNQDAPFLKADAYVRFGDLIVAVRDASQDYLHITLSDEHPQLDAMAKIHEVFPNAMMLDYDNVTVLIDRPQTQLSADPDSMDTLDLFGAFYESQVGNPLDDEQRDFARRLIAKVEDSAAKGPDGQEEGAK